MSPAGGEGATVIGRIVVARGRLDGADVDMGRSQSMDAHADWAESAAEPAEAKTIPGATPTAAQALALQRAIGNRRFSALVNRSRATRPVLQRDWSEPEWEVPWWVSPAGRLGRGVINHFSGSIDIAVVDANDVTGWLSSAVRGRAVEVNSIPDMVAKVSARLSPGQKI